MSVTREFLSKVLPWEQAGPGVFFNLHWKSPLPNPKPGQKPHYWDGRACATLEELEKAVNFFGMRPDADAYICMSSQSRFEEKTSKIGKAYKRAVRFQANVVGLKSFYIDVDVKPEAYATQQEALDAFRLFIEAADLPMPTAVVGSGSGGFHAHWVVERPLSLAEWQPIANALAHACQTFGLICDTQCTIDSARILRIPGTLNYKTNPPNKVTLMSLGDVVSFDDMCEVLEPYVGLTPMGNPDFAPFPFERREPTIDGAELGEGIVVYETHQVKLEKIAEVCPFIEDAICDGGANYNNPLWYMTLQVASFVEEGRDAAHLMSFKHATYDAEQTDAEYDRIVRQHKEKDIGWPKCDKIKLSGATQCAGCPLLASHKSPFNFAIIEEPTLATPSQVVLGTPRSDIWPDRYSQRPDGLIYMSSVTAEGGVTEAKVCPYPISNGWLQDNPWALHFNCTTALGKVAKIELPLEEFGAMGGTRKTLSRHGMVLKDSDFKNTQEFLLAWVQKLQMQKDSVVSSTPFGWSKFPNGDIEGFTYAGRVWGVGTDRPAAHDDAELYDTYSPHGSLDAWLDAASVVIGRNKPDLNCIVAASFAAPLMRFIGHEGLQIAGFSTKSGVGKTSAMVLGLSVWGHPARGKQGLDDTSNSLFGKMGKLKTLPIYWDEIQTAEQLQKAGKLLFQLTGGVEKARMNQDRTLSKRGIWQTIMISTANASLWEAVQQDNKSHVAGLMRIFEFEMYPSPKGGNGEIELGKATRILSRLNDNYGNAGLIYAQFLGANFKRLQQEISDLHDRLNKEVDVLQEERLWTSAMALLLSGARYANELNLTKFDLVGMENFLKGNLQHLRRMIKVSPSDMANQSSVSTVLAQFLNAMRVRHTLITNRIHVGAGKPVKGSVAILNDATKIDGVYVHIGREDHRLRISSSYLGRWMKDHELPRAAFTRALEDEFGFKQFNGIMGSGTHLSTGAKEHIYEIDILDPKLKGFIDLD